MNLVVLGGMFLQICKLYAEYRKRKARRRRMVQPLNRKRLHFVYQSKAFLKMKQLRTEQFFVQIRMSRPLFEKLFKIIGCELFKSKRRIYTEERLFITLHFLAHGVSLQRLALIHKIERAIVRDIIVETCEVLWRMLSPSYVSEPSELQYKDIAKDFKNLWNIPNCVGAVDGKHIPIKCPSYWGAFYNSKSIVLMAACDAKYTFTSVSVESYGYETDTDGGILQICPFGEALMKSKLPLPEHVQLCEESNERFPYYFVGDSAFPLRNNLMRPYSGIKLNKRKRIFNYRLSPAQRCIENAFGILATRWRVLRNRLDFFPEYSETIVLACVALHNFVMSNDHERLYCPEKFVDWVRPDHVIQEGTWRANNNNASTNWRPIAPFARRSSAEAFKLRDKLSDYFLNEGTVPY